MPVHWVQNAVFHQVPGMPDNEYLAGVLRLVEAYLSDLAASSADQVRSLMQ